MTKKAAVLWERARERRLPAEWWMQERALVSLKWKLM